MSCDALTRRRWCRAAAALPAHRRAASVVRRRDPRRHGLRRHRRRRASGRRRDPRRSHRGGRRSADGIRHRWSRMRPASRSRPASSTCCPGPPSRCIADGRSQGEIRQGVTPEIFGEGSSMGPLTDAMKKRAVEQMGDIKYDITWTTLSEYLTGLERRGVSPNVASFVGATTIREHVIGLEDRKPTPAQLDEMRALVRSEMEDGALGIGSSLIYAPGLLRHDRGADRAVQGRGAVSRQVHLAHAQRGQPAARSGRRADPHQPRGAASRPRSITSRRPARRTGRRWTR